MEDSYGRVTDSGRYAVLHDAAHRLLDRLAANFVVDRSDGGPELDPALSRGDTLEVVRLQPRAKSAGPLTVAFSGFPGVYVRFGEWHVAAFPHCGCDACDEQPAALIQELETKVADLVEGRFREEISGLLRRGLGHTFHHSSGWGKIEPGTPLYGHKRARHIWEPWTYR